MTSEQPEDRVPLTSSPDALVDPWGETRFVDLDDPDQAAYGNDSPSIGPALWDLLSSGLGNATFLAGPPDEDAYISTHNPLPGWVLTKDANTCDVQRIGDASYGYSLQFTVGAGIAEDEWVFKHTVPVAPG